MINSFLDMFTGISDDIKVNVELIIKLEDYEGGGSDGNRNT